MTKYSELPKEKQEELLVYIETNFDLDQIREIKDDLVNDRICTECLKESCDCE